MSLLTRFYSYIFSLSAQLFIAILVLYALAPERVEANSRTLCSQSHLIAAYKALEESRTALRSVSNSLSTGGDHTSRLLYKWFGNTHTNTISQVKKVIDKSIFWSNSVVFYCLYKNDGTLTEIKQTPTGTVVVDYSGELFAYVDPSNIGEVTLGLAFYTAPKKGFNSKMGTVIHELTHFWLTGDTDDIEYGRKDCLALAKNTPAKALKNADNFQYFIEDWLVNS